MTAPIAPPAEAAIATCALCGLGLDPARLSAIENDDGARFCCTGCRFVFDFLASSGLADDQRATKFYDTCLAAGLISRPEATEARAAADLSDPGLELAITIDGMWCTACAWLIRELLVGLPGVVAAEVSFLADSATVRYLPHLITPDRIVARLTRFGYQARALTAEADDDRAHSSWWRLGLATILTTHVMMISMALYGGFFHRLEPAGIRSLALPLLLLTTPVLFYCGWPILVRGWQGLRLGNPSMDSLIAIGSLAAYGYSIAGMRSPSLHLYFDTSAMLITLVLIGREVEGRVRRRLDRRLNELNGLTGAKVRLLRAGREEWRPMAAVASGDRFLVRAGERAPVDGRVESGRAAADESMLTGESRPVAKRQGDDLLAGTLLLDGELRLVATRIGAASSLGQVIDTIGQALAAKHPLEQLTDRLSRWFVPLILVLASATFLTLGLRGEPTEAALLRALTVLVIACPCALGLATPLAKVAVLAAGRSRGILIRDPAAFERARRLDVLVLDKTGTVTEGSFNLLAVHSPTMTTAEVLATVAAVEQEADHFLAREIRRQAAEAGGEALVATELRNHVGLGVSGRLGERLMAVGSRRLMADLGLTIPAASEERALAAEQQGATVVFAGWQGEVRALLIFGDPLKPGAADLVAELMALGIEVWLVSGDSTASSAAVAGQLGITNFVGQARPEDKVAIVRRLQGEGRRVAMVGDGVNDAAALAQADVGFALGSSPARLLEEAADVTLFGGALARLPAAIALSKRLALVIRQNLGLACVYNGIGIPLAMLGLLNPLIAVLAMLASSLTVLANTLRVVRLEEGGPDAS